jgi:hypothetical protein
MYPIDAIKVGDIEDFVRMAPGADIGYRHACKSSTLHHPLYTMESFKAATE